MENLWIKKCEICGQECNKGHSSLSRHLNKHKMTLEKYYKKYVKRVGENLCKNCGSETSFSMRYKRYNDFCTRRCQAVWVSKQPQVRQIRSEVMSKTMTHFKGNKPVDKSNRNLAKNKT